MATQVILSPGATTSNVSLPAWAPDIESMPTTTVAGWEILYGPTTGDLWLKTRATTFAARTFNTKVTVGSKDKSVVVVYNAVGDLVRT